MGLGPLPANACDAPRAGLGRAIAVLRAWSRARCIGAPLARAHASAAGAAGGWLPSGAWPTPKTHLTQGTHDLQHTLHRTQSTGLSDVGRTGPVDPYGQTCRPAVGLHFVGRVFKDYEPDPATYLGVARVFDVNPAKVMPVGSLKSGNTTAAPPCCLSKVLMCWTKLSWWWLVVAGGGPSGAEQL